MTYLRFCDRIRSKQWRLEGFGLKRFDRGSKPRFRFLEGRYGADALGRFLSVSGCVIMLLAVVVRSVWNGILSNLLFSLAVVCVVWCYSRVLSRNFTARQKENQWYMQKEQAFYDWFALRRDCFSQRKEYAFFRCPGCGRTVRVPKGKGRIRITCRHCGYSFEKKT